MWSAFMLRGSHQKDPEGIPRIWPFSPEMAPAMRFRQCPLSTVDSIGRCNI